MENKQCYLTEDALCTREIKNKFSFDWFHFHLSLSFFTGSGLFEFVNEGVRRTVGILVPEADPRPEV